MAAALRQAAVAEGQPVHGGLSGCAREGHEVPIHLVPGPHPLALDGAPQGHQAIAPGRGPLVLQGLGRGVHAPLQVGLQLGGVPREDPRGLLHQALVLLPIDQPDAGRAAELELVLDAGPRAIVHLVVGTVPQGDQAMQVREGPTHGAGTGVGPEEAAATAGLLVVGPVRPHELQPREPLGQVQPQHQERLVVLEPQVVRRLVLLDEGVLQQQRLRLGARNDGLDPVRVEPQRGRVGPPIAPLPPVRTQPRPQVRRLPHVQDLPLRIAKQVHARPRRHVAQGPAGLAHERCCSPSAGHARAAGSGLPAERERAALPPESRPPEPRQEPPTGTGWRSRSSCSTSAPRSAGARGATAGSGGPRQQPARRAAGGSAGRGSGSRRRLPRS